MRSLEEKTVLVTGAGTRLGRALALGLAQKKAVVAVHYHRSSSGAADVVAEISKAGGKASAFAADLTRDEDLPNLVRQVEESLGPIAALVNSAALFERAPFIDSSSEMLDRLWALNARAPFLLSREVSRGMLARGGGDILNILDVGGALLPWRGYSAYGMTKAALAHLTQALAQELAPTIRVNAIAPGTVLPPEGMEPQVLERLKAKIPQQAFGSPSDIVEAALFFLTGPTYVTGQILAVDGGRSLGS